MSSLNLITNNKPPAPLKIGRTELVDPITGRTNLYRTYQLATKIELDYGTRYWFNMFDTIAAEVGRSTTNLNIFAGMFCALSPNNTERNNWIDARLVYRHYTNHPCPNIPYHLPIHTYRHTLTKCDAIYNSDHAPTTIMDILSGRKTSSMFMNITAPYANNYVTIDGHMVSCYQSTRLTMDEAGINSAVYSVISSVVKELAGVVGLVPNQLQAVLWLVWRRVHKVPGYRIKDLFQGRLDFD